MNRRRFLGTSICMTGLAGCLDQSDEEFWGEGSVFIRFDEGVMSEEFSGTIRIVPDCRDDDFETRITDGEPDDSIPYERNEDGEECSFEFYIDGEKQDSFSISGTERCWFSIDADGDYRLNCDVT